MAMAIAIEAKVVNVTVIREAERTERTDDDDDDDRGGDVVERRRGANKNSELHLVHAGNTH